MSLRQERNLLEAANDERSSSCRSNQENKPVWQRFRRARPSWGLSAGGFFQRCRKATQKRPGRLAFQERKAKDFRWTTAAQTKAAPGQIQTCRGRKESGLSQIPALSREPAFASQASTCPASRDCDFSTS